MQIGAIAADKPRIESRDDRLPSGVPNVRDDIASLAGFRLKS